MNHHGVESRCTSCCAPASSNVRRLGARGELFVLARCEACGATVDPHTELEPALIALDVLLARRKAVRHCIFATRGTFARLAVAALVLRAAWVVCALETMSKTHHRSAAAVPSLVRGLASLLELACPSGSGRAARLLCAVALAAGELAALTVVIGGGMWCCTLQRPAPRLRFVLRALVVGALPANCIAAIGSLVFEGYRDATASVVLEIAAAESACLALVSVAQCIIVSLEKKSV